MFELEFELENAAMMNWLRCSAEEAEQMTKCMTEELRRLINECIPCHLKFGLELEVAADPQFPPEAARITNVVVPGYSTGAPFAFAGSMPSPISRKNLEVVCKNPYYVTEKTDGSNKLIFTN